MGPELFPRAACLQFAVRPADGEANLATVRKLLSLLQPRENTLVLLPELWGSGFAYPHLERLARQTDWLLAELQAMAGELKIWIGGSLLGPVHGGRPENTFYLVGPAGLAGRYSKHHLFAYWKEDHYFVPGRSPSPMETDFGPVGPLICYDLRFPTGAADLAFAGCRVLTVSAQWPRIRLDHWRVLLRARAIENQVFVVACNSCGISGSIEFGGHSMIVAPDGKILAEGGDKDEAIVAGLDSALLERLRTRFCTAGERPYGRDDGAKVCTLPELLPRLAAIRGQGSRVVFTNGCFDILHAGHVHYLQEARRCGDCLVVGLNADSSVRSLKGPGRPVNSEEERARVLAALGCVDFVTLFSGHTPLDLIRAIRPDVLVKGADWPEEEIVGAAEVKQAGGRVVRIDFSHQVSTSAIISAIRAARSDSD